MNNMSRQSKTDECKILPSRFTPRDQGAVTSASGYIGDALGALDSALAELINRLDHVLSPPTKVDGATTSEPRQSTVSSLANALTQHGRTVDELTRVVREVTERVEL